MCTSCLTPISSFAIVHWAGEQKQIIDYAVRHLFGCKAPWVLVPGVGGSGKEEEKAKLNIKLCWKYFNAW